MLQKDLYQINNVITVSLYVTALMFSGLFLVTASTIESFMFPVVIDFEITRFTYSDGVAQFSGIMEKVRICDPKSVSFWDRDNNTGIMYQLFVDFRPDTYQLPDNLLRQRPEGIQAWGIWEMIISSKLHDDLVVISTHDCHPLWKTETILLEQSFDSLSPDLPRVARPQL